MMIMQGCFPSYAPKEETVKEIQEGDVTLKWVKLVGTLDQNFPEYISTQKGNQVDTLCESHNIADLKIQGDTLVVGFYGTPQQYMESIRIPNEILSYRIVVDTSFVTEK